MQTIARLRINDAAVIFVRGIHYTERETADDRLALDLGDYERHDAFYGTEDGDPRETFAALREPVPSAFAAD